MSGRGIGRHQSCSGVRGSQGRCKSASQIPLAEATATNPQRKHYLGTAQQAADYKTTKDNLINHIKKTFNFGINIGTALEQLEEYNMYKHLPSLQTSTSPNPVDKKLKISCLKMTSRQSLMHI
jgi:hypothetical protein